VNCAAIKGLLLVAGLIVCLTKFKFLMYLFFGSRSFHPYIHTHRGGVQAPYSFSISVMLKSAYGGGGQTLPKRAYVINGRTRRLT